MKIFGVDFTSAPCRRKAITVAAGRLKGMTLAIREIERLETFSAFEALLARPGPGSAASIFPSGCRPSCAAISAGRSSGRRWFHIAPALPGSNCAARWTPIAIPGRPGANMRIARPTFPPALPAR